MFEDGREAGLLDAEALPLPEGWLDVDPAGAMKVLGGAPELDVEVEVLGDPLLLGGRLSFG
jgi:hypothetical protein